MSDLGDDLMIECEDNGPGIPPHWSDSIFERGVSSKEGEHRGIGLSLVKHAVQRLGGTIQHEPSADHGTIFSSLFLNGTPMQSPQAQLSLRRSDFGWRMRWRDGVRFKS